MTAILFAGPSLAAAPDLSLPPGFVLRPPARQGDVYRAALKRPRALGIIDGYFEGVPSVWHKEILWALSQGIAVYGSASIGALRAAELHTCGMIGVGEIFAEYRDGALEADDEVALLHGPGETGFVALTEPLVNVRTTCRAASAAGIFDEGEANQLVGVARSIFYKDRTWREIARQAAGGRFSRHRLSRFTTWLPDHRIDQKQLDALEMIRRMHDVEAPAPLPDEFEPTFLWERAVAGWSRAEAIAERPTENLDDAVLNELRLDPERYRLLRARARARMQMLHEADDAVAPTREEQAAARAQHRLTHGLLRAAELDRWLGEQHLDRSVYDRLIDEAAIVESVATREDPEVHRNMVMLLKLDGEFGAAAKRAAAKAAALAAGAGTTQAAALQLPPALLGWYFRTRLQQETPEDIDSYIRGLGLASREAFYSLLAEEYVYLSAQDTIRMS